MGADNQQERLDKQWIVGFVDGEGCFHVSINRNKKMTSGWQALPEFRVVQHQRDEFVLEKIKDFFGFGLIRVNHGDRKEFRVRRLEHLNALVSFFEKQPLRTSKRKDFELFATIVQMMNNREQLTHSGLTTIANISSKMNRKRIPGYLKSSEAIRQTIAHPV